MAEKIHILLPVHNRCETTRRFIECLKRQTYRNYHLVLIDDGSTDGTEQMVRAEIETLTIIKGHGNWWWAGSLQQGYQWLKLHARSPHDLVLIINDDTEFEDNFLETAVNLLSGIYKTKTLLLARCYSRDDKRLLDAGVHVDWKRLTFEHPLSPDQVNCLSTRGLFLRTEDFFVIGGFFPRLLPHYTSDYEFTIRAHRKGMKLATDPALKLWLDEKTTGHHHFNREDSFSSYIQTLFSYKSVSNPLFWTSFILLSCPWKWKMLNIARVWERMISQSIKRINPWKAL